jgi:hypothetical protein
MSKDSNGTSAYASDSEDNKSNASDSSFEDESKGSNDTTEETFSESNGVKSSALVEELFTIPIVNQSYETAKRYKLVRMTIDFADAGARKVSDLAKPVSDKFSDQIEKADRIAAESVQRLSTQFPIVKEPTDRIFKTVSCTIEDNITTPGSRFVAKFDSQLTPLVDVIEDLIKKVIPDENVTSRDIHNDQQLDQLSQTLRVLHIALATRDRCVEKVKKQISTVQNPEIAVTLHAHLQSIATVILGDLNKDEDLPRAVQAKIIELSTTLLTVTECISNYVKLNAEHFPEYLPEYLQERLKPLVVFFGQGYGEIVNEIKNGEGSPLEKAKNIVQFTTNQTLPLLRASLSDLQEAFQWYKTSLNTSFHSTTESVVNKFNQTTQILNVK